MDKMAIIEEARKRGSHTLSEHKSKMLLAEYGIPITREGIATTEEEALRLAADIGYPVALKGSGEQIRHKTEMDLIRLHLKNEQEVRSAFRELTSKSAVVTEVLVQEMVKGQRELLIGLIRDPQFGPCVMLSIGGVMTEVFEETCFRMAPLDMREAKDMAEELRYQKILGPFRGQKPVDMDALCRALVAVGQIGVELESVSELDINPLTITPQGDIVAVDALVVLK